MAFAATANKKLNERIFPFEEPYDKAKGKACGV